MLAIIGRRQSAVVSETEIEQETENLEADSRSPYRYCVIVKPSLCPPQINNEYQLDKNNRPVCMKLHKFPRKLIPNTPFTSSSLQQSSRRYQDN